MVVFEGTAAETRETANTTAKRRTDMPAHEAMIDKTKSEGRGKQSTQENAATCAKES